MHHFNRSKSKRSAHRATFLRSASLMLAASLLSSAPSTAVLAQPAEAPAGHAVDAGPAAVPAPARSANAAPAKESGAASAPHFIALTPEQQKLLEQSQFVYISSSRKDGTLSRPAEIWFYVDEGAVWVASSPDSWRVKRIRWGRPDAKIAIGTTSGPSLWASGDLVKDAAAANRLCDAFAKKYAGSWPRWESSFREGLKSGERVLIRYRPIQR